MKVTNAMKNPGRYFWIVLLHSTNLMAPVWTLFFLHKQLDFSQVFTLYAIITVSMLLFEVPTGIIGDRFGRKTSIICGHFGWIVFGTGLIFAQSFWTFAALFVLWGFNATFSSGSDEALIYDSLKQAGRQNEMKKHWARISSAKFAPLVVLAPIAAVIAKDLAAYQFTILLIGNLLFNIVALVLAFTLTEPRVESGPHETRSPVALLKSSLRHIRRSPELVRLFMNLTLVLIPGAHIFRLLWQPYLQESGIPVAFFGVLVSVSSAIIFLTGRHVQKIEEIVGGRRLLFYTALLPMLAFAAAAFFTDMIVAIAVYAVLRLLIWLRNPVFSHYMNQHIESHNRATVLSSLSMIDSFFDVVIFISAGLITDIGMNYAFLFSAGLMLCAIVFFRVSEKHIRVRA